MRRFKQTAVLAIATVGVGTFAGPIGSSGAWTLKEQSGGATAAGNGEGEQVPGGVGVAPGATEPQPVNKQTEEEFDRDPPWQQAKEKSEREAAEHVASSSSSESKTTSTPALQCVVPALKGDSLAAARHSLTAAHCTLGKVSRPQKHRVAFVVEHQSQVAGKMLAKETPIAVSLGVEAQKHRGG
jgi:hypothetical protein